jgi:hypothetical protein
LFATTILQGDPMLQLNVNLPELKDFAKALPEFKGNFFSLVRLDIKQAATEFVNDLLQCEFDLFIGREKYQRDAVFLTPYI